MSGANQSQRTWPVNEAASPAAVTSPTRTTRRIGSSLRAPAAAQPTSTPADKLAEKTADAQTTTYTCDALGNLRPVPLPGGRIVAELDGANARVSLFLHATTPNTPDLMLRDGTAYRIVTDQLGSVRISSRCSSAAAAEFALTHTQGSA